LDVQYRSIAILFPPPSRDWTLWLPDWQQNANNVIILKSVLYLNGDANTLIKSLAVGVSLFLEK
jgi:hypothetical protein